MQAAAEYSQTRARESSDIENNNCADVFAVNPALQNHRRSRQTELMLNQRYKKAGGAKNAAIMQSAPTVAVFPNSL